MRIAVVGPLELPSTQGGMTRHCEELYSRLAARGHDVTVLCQIPRAGPDGRFRGMRLRRVPGTRLPGWERLGYSLVASLQATLGPYDVVHYHSFASCGFCLLPRLRRKRVVVTVHRLEWQDEKWGLFARSFLRWSERAAMRSADLVIAVSQNFAEDLGRRYPRARPMHYVPNGVTPMPRVDEAALRQFGLAPRSYILFVGRLVPEKGVHLLVEAFERIRDLPEAAGCELVIVGSARQDSPYVRDLRARGEVEGSRVRLLGVQTGDVLAALYGHARLFVLPSFHEGQPLTVLEAMSAGLPVVASDIPAHRELVAGSGMLFPCGDAVGLADTLRRVLGDPAEAERIAEAGRRRMQEGDEYQWERIAAETDGLLRSL